MNSATVAPMPNVWCTGVDSAGLPTPTLVAPDHVFVYDEDSGLLSSRGGSLVSVRHSFVNGGLAAAKLLDGLHELSDEIRVRLFANLEMDGGTFDDGTDGLHAGISLLVACLLLTDAGPTVTVIVGTRGRGETLRGCAVILHDMQTAGLDFVILDYARTDDLTARTRAALVERDGLFRYVVKPRPSLSCARERSLAEATNEVIATTDDDVLDPYRVTVLL